MASMPDAADIRRKGSDVQFEPESDMQLLVCDCATGNKGPVPKRLTSEARPIFDGDL